MLAKIPQEVLERIAVWIRGKTDFATNVSVALSGGVDSALVAAAACKARGSKNVVVSFRGIHSAPQHLRDAQEIACALGIDLVDIDLTDEYESMKAKVKQEFKKAGREWHDEDFSGKSTHYSQNAYQSCKSRFTTPLMGLMSKMACPKGGVILGTGNFEEDEFLRYYDKYGDGAIDFSPIIGLYKVEVRQLVLYLKDIYNADVFERVAYKIPSADLKGIGDAQSDEGDLTAQARARGYANARLTYGDLENEGTIAWVARQEDLSGIITGRNSLIGIEKMIALFGYQRWQAETVAFIREIERETRHKKSNIPGLERRTLIKEGYVK